MSVALAPGPADPRDMADRPTNRINHGCFLITFLLRTHRFRCSSCGGPERSSPAGTADKKFDYSSRSAAIGSNLAARHAGSSAAPNATAARMNAESAKVAGPFGPTPYRTVAMR